MNTKQILAQLEAINNDYNKAIASLKADDILICSTYKPNIHSYWNKSQQGITPQAKTIVLSPLLNGHAKLNELIQSLSVASPETKAKQKIINTILKKLHDADKALTVDNVMTSSLFMPGCNLVEADIPLIESAIMQVLNQS